MNRLGRKIINAAIKSKSIFKIRSAYHKCGYPENKLFSSLKGSFRNKITSIKSSNRCITLNEAKDILVEANKLDRKVNNDILKIVSELVKPYSFNKNVTLKKKAISTVWPAQDTSLPTLLILQAEGYNHVEWECNSSAIDTECLILDSETWTLDEFLSGMRHNAPIFGRSHPNCLCSIRVSGPQLEDQVIQAY